MEIRPLTDEEFPAWPKVFGRAFGFQPSDANIESWRAQMELDRTLAAFDRGEVVGTAGAHSLELTLPGLTTVPAAGVTAVAVRSTHRRQGVLTSLMRRQLDDVRANGEPLALLYASEAVIYGRFGYGLATVGCGYAIDTARAGYAAPFTTAGRLVHAEPDAAAKVLPGVHDQARKAQPGDINRGPAWWEEYFKDPEHERDGASGRFYTVYESKTGKAEGYVAYRVRSKWEHNLPGQEIRVEDLVAASHDAYLSLWRHVLDVDLARTVVADRRPLDEPVRHALADARQLRARVVADQLWARIVDVPTALAARRYAFDGGLTVEVADDFGGLAAGRFAVDGGPDGASSAPTRRKADLALTVADLGAVYLGGITTTALVRAGRIDERTRGAAARADAWLSTTPGPWCRTGF